MNSTSAMSLLALVGCSDTVVEQAPATTSTPSDPSEQPLDSDDAGDDDNTCDAESGSPSRVAAGYTVVVPDYEGELLEWAIGRQSAYAALDGVLTAEAVLALPASTPVGLIGYSGGSVPTQWGAEAAVTYAQYTGQNHSRAFVPFQAQAAQFLTDRFNGVVPTSNCAVVGPGKDLSPAPISQR